VWPFAAYAQSDTLRDSGLRPSLPASGRAVAQATDPIVLGSGAGSTGYISAGEQSGRPKKKKKSKTAKATPASAPLYVIEDPQPGQKMNPRIGATTPPPIHKRPVDDDPYGPVGFHAGAFLVKPSVEISFGDFEAERRNLRRLRQQSFSRAEWSRLGFHRGERRGVSEIGMVAPRDAARPARLLHGLFECR
jgi:hypothetical protein